MNSRSKRQHSKKQKTSVKKVIKKVAPKKRKSLRLTTYEVSIRKNRNSKRSPTDTTVTSSDERIARQLAAAKYPNNWVSVSPLR